MHIDDRGFFSEISVIPQIQQHINRDFKVIQSNLAHSKSKVMRGLHAESWNKLVTVVTGDAYCVMVDLRPESKSFKKTLSILLGTSKRALWGSIYIPSGVANSVAVTNGPMNYLYQVDKLYSQRDPAGDFSINMFDPDLNIQWPASRDEAIISDRDKKPISLREHMRKNC